jgi:hypothetical protein
MSTDGTPRRPGPDVPEILVRNRWTYDYREGRNNWHIVGRPSALGNPYVIGRDGTREEVIARYAVWLDEQLADPDSRASRSLARLLDSARRVGALVLLCYCHPQKCHADVIKARLEARL